MYLLCWYVLGRLGFHYVNENENDNEILLSFSLRFCKQSNEQLIASISSYTTTISNRKPGRTQDMMTSAHTNFVLVLVVVVVVKFKPPYKRWYIYNQENIISWLKTYLWVFCHFTAVKIRGLI